MERNINFAYIGGLFLVIVVAMVGFLIWMGGGNLDQSQYRSYITYSTEGVSGVGVGTMIRYKGISVGKVTQVDFKDGDTNAIQIKMLIDSKIKLLEGACISVESQGLAGSVFLNVLQGKGKELGNGSELCYQKGFMGKLFDNIDQSGGDVREIIAEIKAMFNDKNNQNIQEMIEALKVIVKNLDQTRKNIDNLSITANQTIGNLNTALQRGDYNVRQILAPTMMSVENSLSQIDRFFSKANLLLDRLEKSPYEAIFGKREEEEKK